MPSSSTLGVNKPTNGREMEDVLRREQFLIFPAQWTIAICCGLRPASRAICSPGTSSRMTHESDELMDKECGETGPTQGTASIGFQISWENPGSPGRGSGGELRPLDLEWTRPLAGQPARCPGPLQTPMFMS